MEKTMIDKTAEITRRAMQIPRQFRFSVDEITISWKDTETENYLSAKLMGKSLNCYCFYLFYEFYDRWNCLDSQHMPAFICFANFTLFLIAIKSHYCVKLLSFITAKQKKKVSLLLLSSLQPGR
jgi:hypothetical protein